MARSATVTSSLLVTSSPSPPVPAPWFLKLRIVLSGPLPRSVTWLTSSESVECEVEPAFAELDHVAGLGIDQRGLGPLGGALAGVDRDHAGSRRSRCRGSGCRNDRDRERGRRTTGETSEQQPGTTKCR